MRIAIVGTCQVNGMAAAAARALPDALVEAHVVDQPLTAAQIAQHVAGADLLLTQIADGAGQAGELSRQATEATVGMVLFVPPAVFLGFHPDMTYVNVNGAAIDGPVSQYHSKIALFGFLAGLPAERTERLYNAHVFDQLGYFQAYDIAARQLGDTMARQGIDLAAALTQWRTNGTIFMHTINHPTIELLHQLTRSALARAGILDADGAGAGDLHDALANSVVGPVYRPLADRLGVVASDAHLQPTEWVAAGESRAVPIAAYVDKSYQRYRGYAVEDLRTAVAGVEFDRLQALFA